MVAIPYLIDEAKASSFENGDAVALYPNSGCWQCPGGEGMGNASLLTKSILCINQHRVEEGMLAVTVTKNAQDTTSFGTSLRVTTPNGRICWIDVDDVKVADN